MKSNIIKKWEIGDCFISKIESTKYIDYNDKYLIVIISGYYQFDLKNEKSIYPTAYLKISSKEVKSFQDIDDAEFIIYDKIPWSWRYLPYSGLKSDDELRKERDKIKLYPDEYYFLNEYQVKVLPCRLKNSILKSYEYIQYFDFKKPKDEFFHWQIGLKNYFQGILMSTPWCLDIIIERYRRYNLRKWVFYQLPLEEMIKHKDSLTPIYNKYYENFIKDYDENSDINKNEN